MRKIVSVSIAILVICSCLAPLAFARTNTYTLDHSPSGAAVPPGNVQMTAVTTDPEVNTVTFYWDGPGGISFTDTVTSSTGTFTSTHPATSAGQWYVTADFGYFSGNNLWKSKSGVDDQFTVNAFVLPESSLGTAMAIVAPLLAVALMFVVKRKSQSKLR
jgi:hypothetical protein